MKESNMDKIINLNDTVYSLCKDDENLKQILYELGFLDVIKPVILNTAGRFMTLKKGSQFKNIPLEKIIKTLNQNGYQVTGE
jgi:hypothetical protein